MLKHISIALMLLFPMTAKAQTASCAEQEGFHDFDFWIGEWAVTANGALAGYNSIKATQDHCLLAEDWRGAQGSTGSSINYYNPISQTWRQVWVAAAGYMIDIEGGLNSEGAMHLKGTISYYSTGKSHPFQGIWTPNDDQSVRQHFQQYNEDTSEWIDWFDGLYRKSEEQ